MPITNTLPHLQVAEEIAQSERLMENFHSLSGGSNRFRKSNRRGRRNTTSRSNRLKRSNRFVGGGRTWNVPVANPSVPFEMPGPSHNNGWTTGAACAGAHCGVPVTPTISNMIHNNLQGDFTLQVPGSSTQYMVGSGEQLPGVQVYGGTEFNPGPFNFNCVSGGSNNKLKNNRTNNHNIHRANLSRRARYLRNRR